MTTAVVVGSGPNGLAAALTLADAGIAVTVIEAADTLGGGIRSSELTVDGVIHDDCAGFHPLALGSAFAAKFDLAGAGLRWLAAPAEFAHPLDGSDGAVALHSPADTAATIGDPRWESLFGPLTERFDTIADEFLQPMLHLPRHPIHLARFGIPSGMPAAVLAKWFDTEGARALFGGVAAHAFRPFTSPASSAIGVALTTAAHRFGWVVAQGGSQSIRDAIVARAVERGVTFETGRRVGSLSELGRPDIVMLDTVPAAAADICGESMPARVRNAYRRYRHAPGVFKVDFAVRGQVPWTYRPARQAGTIHLGGSFAEMAAGERDVVRGRLPDRPFVLVGQQYLADPSRSRDGVNPLYSYAHVPAGYTGDATAAIISRIEQFVPGFRDTVEAMYVRSTTEMSRYNANYVGGDVVSGSNDLGQLVFRPRVAINPYSTGIDGVYLCSAATPPGAGAHGMCGFHAANRAIDAAQ